MLPSLACSMVPRDSEGTARQELRQLLPTARPSHRVSEQPEAVTANLAAGRQRWSHLMSELALGHAILCLFALSCENNATKLPHGPAPTSTASAGAANGQNSPLPVPEHEPTAAGRRELHPLDGNSDCMEMYSACTMVNGENQCTSAPLLLACGETGRLPSTGEQLTCVCP